MPSSKKAPSWRPPTKRTSFQDQKKRRPQAHAEGESPRGERRRDDSADRRPAEKREGAPFRSSESRPYKKNDRKPVSGERRPYSGDDRRPPRDGGNRTSRWKLSQLPPTPAKASSSRT